MRRLLYILTILGFFFFFPLSSKQNVKPEIPSSYRVTKGDSWFGIAKKFKISPETLARLNGRSTKENLYERELLRIPKGEEKVSIAPESLLSEKPTYPLMQKEKVVKKFSELTYDPHKGIQFQRGVSSLVRASLPGKVVHVDYMDGYENFVILEHQNGLYSVYGNLERIQVTEGQQVKSKDRLGILTKDKGLYFQMNRQKLSLNPERILERGI
ncbi:murein hydrolase activator EnvC [Leptospira sp. WS4.C2]